MRTSETPRRLRSVVSLALALAWILILPQIATASVVVSNHLEGNVGRTTTGPQLFSYTEPQTATFDTAMDFERGSFDDTQVDANGEFVQLAGATTPSDWWDTAWGARRCFQMTNPSSSPLNDHPVRLVFDSTTDLADKLVQATGADYRAIAADNSTVLDLWLEHGPGLAETVLWVQLDLPAATTSDLCTYFDNADAKSVSSEAAFPFASHQEDADANKDTAEGVDHEVELVTTVAHSPEMLQKGVSTGTWTSPVIDTTTGGSNVFGLFGTKATVPDSTSVTLQFARGETPALALDADFVGPDGTADTSFEIGELPAPFDWDFADQFVVARLTLATSKPGTSPTVEAFTLDYDLAEVGVSTSHLIDNDGPDQTDFLLRVWVEDPVLAGAAVTGHYVRSSSAEPTAEAKVVIGSETQVGVAARVVVQSSGNPVPTGPGAPHNVSVSTTDMSGSSLTVTWQAVVAGSSILIPHEITMTFA